MENIQEKIKVQEQQVADAQSPAVVVGDSSEEQGQRGKYRQYEDPLTLIEKIRFYRTQRFPDSEIMKRLGNMPRRTYYNYVKKLQEQDREIMEEWAIQNMEQVAEDFVIYRENICKKLRELQLIVDNKTTSAKDKIKAIEQYLAVSEKLVNLNKPISWYLEEAERRQDHAEVRRSHIKNIEEIRRMHQNEASSQARPI